ncbi:hypothetical protein Lal_00035527, partial [Lupinus albus]
RRVLAQASLFSPKRENPAHFKFQFWCSRSSCQHLSPSSRRAMSLSGENPSVYPNVPLNQVFVFHLLPSPNSVLLLPPWKAGVVRGVHDVGRNAARQDKLETKIDSLTTLITQLAINQQTSSMARVCGICTSSDHYSDMCPSLLDPRTGDLPEAYAANIYNNRPPHQQQHYDPPSSSTYNPGWRNQAPFQNNNVGQNISSYVPPPIHQ